MYTDEQLDQAINEEIFSAEQVSRFRSFVKDVPNQSEDRENFQLISGFHDVFIVISTILSMLCLGWILGASTDKSISGLVLTAISWGLAEFFVKRKRMALTAVVLLFIYVIATFTTIYFIFEDKRQEALALAGGISLLATYLHWLRFRVPITIAAAMATLLGTLFILIPLLNSDAIHWLKPILFLGGIVTFSLAMYWDTQDTKRITRHSDIAFWLHLIAAPLIVHPVFMSLGGSRPSASMDGIDVLLITLLYLMMTLVSLIIDRRAFMVSALVYIIAALMTVFRDFGISEAPQFSYAGVIVGFSLLLISGFWYRARSMVVALLPDKIRSHVPPAV